VRQSLVASGVEDPLVPLVDGLFRLLGVVRQVFVVSRPVLPRKLGVTLDPDRGQGPLDVRLQALEAGDRQVGWDLAMPVEVALQRAWGIPLADVAVDGKGREVPGQRQTLVRPIVPGVAGAK